ncbi:MAG: hypothetical protein WBX25_09330 [Rhodomicrobium sp.]
MTEAEILGSAIQAAQAAAAIFSLFLAIVSAYIVGLYLFLHKAPFGLRFPAFILLTISFAALGALALNMQYLGEGMHTAWLKLPQKATGMDLLGPPIIVRSLFLDGRLAAAWSAWLLGGVVYVALTYLTFIYRWQPRPQML